MNDADPPIPRTPSEIEEVRTAVEKKLNEQEVRPLTDQVIVKAAEILTYTIDATLYFNVGPGSDKVLKAAKEAVENYVDQHYRLGEKITTSGLHAALHQCCVAELELIKDALFDEKINTNQAPFCNKETDINIQDGGIKP